AAGLGVAAARWRLGAPVAMGSLARHLGRWRLRLPNVTRVALSPAHDFRTRDATHGLERTIRIRTLEQAALYKPRSTREPPTSIHSVPCRCRLRSMPPSSRICGAWAHWPPRMSEADEDRALRWRTSPWAMRSV